MAELTSIPDKSRFATKNRQLRQHNLREYLRGAAYVRVLEGIAARADEVHKDTVPGLALKAKIYLDLLAKVLPDLKAIEHSGSIAGVKPEELSDDRLAHIASRGRDGDSATPGSQTEPSELH